MWGLTYYSYAVVFFQDDYEIFIDNTDLLFSNGTSIGVHWSPLSILPVVDPEDYSVDIKLIEMSFRRSQELATLGRDLPNTGLASVTVPPIAADVVRDFRDSITPVIVQILISSNTTSGTSQSRKRGITSEVLQRLRDFDLQTSKHSSIRYAMRIPNQTAQQEFCADWAGRQLSEASRNLRIAPLPPCPRNVMVARAPNSGFIEERLTSRVRVIGTIPGYDGDRIIDNESQEFFNPGTSVCFRQRGVNRR